MSRNQIPDNRIRVNLSLPDDVVAVLDRIGASTGAGRASIIREWLLGALPALVGVAKALEAASVSQTKAFQVLEDTLNRTTDQAQAALDLGRPGRAMRMKGRVK
jgi:hypothetical protein